MTLDSLLNSATLKLIKYGSNTARLDTLLILENATGHDRSYLLAHPELKLNDDLIKTIDSLLVRRLSGEPMAYILGKKEFYGREFILTPDVLVPRPESETIIELLIKHQTATKSSPVQIIDVGTGSGCLAITAKLEIPELEVLACDISQLAIDTAKANATKLGADVKFFVSNLLSNADSTFDYILANLPYVPTSLKVTKDVLAEPKIAVFAGSDGLDTIRRLLIQCPTKLRPNGVAIFESLKIQHAAISKLAQANSLELVDTQGLVQVFKRI